MTKKQYYVNLQSKEISQIKYHNNADFTIYATDTEVMLLRKKLDSMHDAEMDTFWRSHVPIMPYHRDESNDRHDASLADAFQMIYDLGDEQAKEFAQQSGLLSHTESNDNL